MRQMEGASPGWAGYGPRPRSAYAYVARVLLDEGVAHYVDWRSREGSDTLFTAKPGARENRAFSQLQLAAKRLRERPDRETRDEVLQIASTGPLGSKYGAISGMFAAWRIESRLGADSLRAAVVRGTVDFLRMSGYWRGRHLARPRAEEFSAENSTSKDAEFGWARIVGLSHKRGCAWPRSRPLVYIIETLA